MKEWIRGKFVNFLLLVDRWVAILRDKYDYCYACIGIACDTCESCGRRGCSDHMSSMFEDYKQCSDCDSSISPEEREEMRSEGVSVNCEMNCHSAHCPCTRLHVEHDESCASCKCDSEHNCGSHDTCVPSGYQHPQEIETHDC